MKTRLISLLLGASCALCAGAEVKIDAAMPGGCLAKVEIDGDNVHLTRDYRDTEGVQQSGYGYRAADDLLFANQHEKTLYPKDWNGFGRDILLAYREYL